MDNEKLSDLGAVLGALSKNPAILSTIGELMGNVNKKTPPEEPKSPDIGAILGLLGAGAQKEPQPSLPESKPLGSKEDMQNRIALLNAVKPFLSEQRREKLELIIKLMKLFELGELTKLLGRLN